MDGGGASGILGDGRGQGILAHCGGRAASYDGGGGGSVFGVEDCRWVSFWTRDDSGSRGGGKKGIGSISGVMNLRFQSVSFFVLETGQGETRGLWDTVGPMEILVHLFLMAALAGTVLILCMCCKKYCYPVGRSGSYVSIKFERSSTEGVGDGSGDGAVGPIAGMAVKWARVRGTRAGLGREVWRRAEGAYGGAVRRIIMDIPAGAGEGEEALECESPGHWTGSYVTFGEVS